MFIMNKIETAKKIISKTKLALVKYVLDEDISKAEKLSFMKFIKESSNYSVLHFAAKGSFPKNKNVPVKNLLEQACNIQNKKHLNELGITTALGVAATALLISKAAHLYFTRAQRAAEKACEKYRGNERFSCITRYKTNSLKMELSKLESGINKCNQSVNPEQCKQKVKERMDKLKEKIQKTGMTL